MGNGARVALICTFLIIAFPFGIILLLMLFSLIGNAKQTGYIYITNILDYVVVYIFLNFSIPLFISTSLIFIRHAGRKATEVIAALLLVLLLIDIKPLIGVIEDASAGVLVGIPWTTVLMALHAVLFALVLWMSRRMARA